MKYTTKAKNVARIFHELKKESGSHSPSIDVLCEKANLTIQVDACFLSNPYATELFLEQFEHKFPSVKSMVSIFENYPPQNKNMAEVVSEIVSVSKERILVGNGAQEIIEWLMKRHANSTVALPIPTYSSYYESISSDSQMAYFQLDRASSFELDLEEYSEFIARSKANIAVIINPNNPNGGYVKKAALEQFCAQNQELDLILIDDSFSHFAYEDLDFELISNSNLDESFSNVVVVKSMSKDFGVAGIRAGYSIMSPDLVKQALSNGFLWNSNGFAYQFFNILKEPTFAANYEVVRKKYIMNTLHMFKELSALDGLHVFPSLSNFYLVQVEEEESGSFGFNLLANHGVYIRNCDDKIGLGPGYYRVASRSFEENLKIIAAIKEVLT